MMAEQKKVLDNRIEWIDLAKGIAILLVIIGHTIGGPLRGAIFSFHMPLFFILSCVTFQYSKDNAQFVAKTKKAFKHLMIPAYVMYGLVIVILVLKRPAAFASAEYVKTFVLERILTGIFASGVEVSVGELIITPMGVPWFMVALFLGRTLFDYLHLKLSDQHLRVSCILLSIVGVCLGKMIWLPFSFDIVLAILPFFYVGMSFDKFQVEDKPVKKLFINGVIWAVILLLSYVVAYNYLELAGRRYTLYPLCYVAAVAGTLVVSEFSVIACSLKKIVTPLLYLGKNSLYMLCIHILDFSLFTKLWNISDNLYVNAIARVIVDSIIFGVFMLLVEKRRKNRQFIEK